jgi:hypothetical protein
MLRGKACFSSIVHLFIVYRSSFFFRLSSGVGWGGKEERERERRKRTMDDGRRTKTDAFA